jgi:maltooligosyltrehalose trehalohydrolase
MRSSKLNLAGAILVEKDKCDFSVWAPLKKRMILHLPDEGRKLEMKKDEDGYFRTTVEGVSAGTNYFFMPDAEQDYPDPASQSQAKGVHGPSQVVDHSRFVWHDDMWTGLSFKDLIIYELHVGTFTAEGTFAAIIPRLDDLIDVGINTLEIMPVAQFPGKRNWGYDGVFPYAVQDSYGGPEGFRQLVNACHQKGIAVFLDVVYNHIGPEGNYFSRFAPYFTNKYWTPWGDALNFDKEWSDGVRDYFCNNALFWFEYFHVDGLRLDAIHMVHDEGACHFWQYLSERVHTLEQHTGHPLYLIGESDLNSPRTINPPALGGYGLTAQWLDDFHHSLYVFIDPKGIERYYDFGRMEQLAKAYTDGFVHSGEYVSFRKRKYGSTSAGIAGDRFVVFTTNHDQVGNRPLGDRPSTIVSFERLKVAAAALLFAPYVPMLFMGEEYAETSPFFYFVSHTDRELIEAIRKGRKEEFAEFRTTGESPDPLDEKTFFASKLQWNKRHEGVHAIALKWYKRLISLRREIPALRNYQKNDVLVHVLGQHALIIYRQNSKGQEPVICLLNFSDQPLKCTVPFAIKTWTKILDSRSSQWTENENRRSAMPDTVVSGEEFTLLQLTAVIYQAQ